MEERRRKRLELLYKQLDHYYDDFHSSISTYNVFLIQNKLGPLLQTVSSIGEMYYSNPRYQDANSTDKSFLYGLVRANNLIKHNQTVIEIVEPDTIPLFEFPIVNTFEVGCEVIAWKNVGNYKDKNDGNKHRKMQIKAYQEKLVGEEISIAVKKTVEFLKGLKP